MASTRGFLNIQSLNELTYENIKVSVKLKDDSRLMIQSGSQQFRARSAPRSPHTTVSKDGSASLGQHKY
jgi:hypothetical protein